MAGILPSKNIKTYIIIKIMVDFGIWYSLTYINCLLLLHISYI